VVSPQQLATVTSITVTVYSMLMYIYMLCVCVCVCIHTHIHYTYIHARARIQLIHKLIPTAGCGISHKHTKYIKYAQCRELLKCEMLYKFTYSNMDNLYA
jgi:hypothetical protein